MRLAGGSVGLESLGGAVGSGGGEDAFPNVDGVAPEGRDVREAPGRVGAHRRGGQAARARAPAGWGGRMLNAPRARAVQADGV
eukprot:12010562-Alexandrium_andersonii.AAC.1